MEDGNDTDAVAAAIEEAQKETRRPSMLLMHTHIGFGSPKKHDNFSAHGNPLGEEELAATKKNLGWPTMEKFFLPDDAVHFFRQAVSKGKTAQSDWQKRFEAYAAAFPSESAELKAAMDGSLPQGWNAHLPTWKPTDKPVATRVAGGEVLNALAKGIHNIIGGSADLNPSTNTALKEMGDFQPPDFAGPGAMGSVGGEWGYEGRNIAFGVREHAMGAAVNGMAAHGGVLPFSATFLVFSDYMKPSVRLGALSQLKAFYVFTHDSIGVGQDGPTHEPVEQIAGLRAIPGLIVMRPADATETAEAWSFAVQHAGPTLFALTRQNVPHLDRTVAVEPGVVKGAYVLADAEGGKPEAILIGTGSEVSLCVKAQEKLKTYGIRARVVSMPSWELFAAQDSAYRNSVLPPSIKKRVSVEAAATMGWQKWVGDEGTAIGLDHYGASAPGEEIMKNFGFTAEHVTSVVLRSFGRGEEADKEFGGETSFAPTGASEGHS